MRHVLLVAILSLIAAPLAQAQDAAPAKSAEHGEDRVQLIEDDKNGVLRIVIDGKEVGKFDAAGLRVEGTVEGSQGIVTENVHGQPLPAVHVKAGAAP